ncbi:MAG: cell division protein SepF [Clostridia bacterium]|nr:cell division protein SepF [Clostridia bacterium]
MSEKKGGFLSSFMDSIGLSPQPQEGEPLPEYEAPPQPGSEELLPDYDDSPTDKPRWWKRRNAERPNEVAEMGEDGVKLVSLSGRMMQMMLYQPLTYRDMHNIIDNLRAGRPVIVNVENLTEVSAQRVVDILAGAIYAFNGQIRHVSRCIFVLTPINMDIGGNMVEQEDTQRAAKAVAGDDNANIGQVFR